MPTETFDARGRPRIWHHDYLHLRPLAIDLAERCRDRSPLRVLDVGSGRAPYRGLLPARTYVTVDRDAGTRPAVVGRAESLPFADGVFDVVLSTQLLDLVDDPSAFGREVARVVRPGGLVLVSTPAAWPYDSARVEHRFGLPQLEGLFPGMAIRETVRQGGMLALPFALFSGAVREAMRAGERRVGAVAVVARPVGIGIIVLSNLAGRLLERLAARGPLSAFLGYLDARLPMNWLVVAERRS